MDDLQSHTNPTFQSFNLTHDGHSSSDFSLSSSEELLFLHAEIESSDAIIMPVMVIEAANIEEQSMKATLDRLSRESVEKDVQIKLRMSKLLS